MNIKEFVEVDAEKMSGTPVFTGTRVPINHLFDYLEEGDSLGVFLDDFPTVTRAQALGVLELCASVSSLNMKLLLDECNPTRLKRDLSGHDVSTVYDAGLRGLKRPVAASRFWTI